MTNAAFEARTARMNVAFKASIAIDALFCQRNELFAMPAEERPVEPKEIVRRINALASAGVYEMIGFATSHEVTQARDLEWICRKMLVFVCKGAWDMFGTAEEIIQGSWLRIGKDIPAELTSSLGQMKEKQAEYTAKHPKPVLVITNTMHPHGKASRLSRAETEKRRAENRANRLAAQPVKGKSPPPPNGFKNPAGKKKEK